MISTLSAAGQAEDCPIVVVFMLLTACNDGYKYTFQLQPVTHLCRKAVFYGFDVCFMGCSDQLLQILQAGGENQRQSALHLSHLLLRDVLHKL